MAPSGRTAKRLAAGPTLLLAAEVSDEIADALVAYDPALRVRSDRFAFGNGVLLHGPVEVTAELAAKAGLPASTASAYYADIIETGTRGSRPDQAKWQDAERLVRGLAARLGGTVHGQRPAMNLNLSASVYTAQPLPAEQVISVLQPYTDDALFADEDQDVPGAYYPRLRAGAPVPHRLLAAAAVPVGPGSATAGPGGPARSGAGPVGAAEQVPGRHGRPGHPAHRRGGGPGPGPPGGRGRDRPVRLSRHPPRGSAPPLTHQYRLLAPGGGRPAQPIDIVS